MAGESGILTVEQEKFLDLFSQENRLRKVFYFTGGTALTAFYLQHRHSEDVDLFSEDEINLLAVRSFVGKVQKECNIEKVDYRQFLGLHSFQLFFPNKIILKVDFNYYPFLRIEKGLQYKNIDVDSILDIAVNKVHTIAMKPRARDFIDLFFIVREKGYAMDKLVSYAKAKFDWHIDPVQLGSRFIAAVEQKDYPRMIKPIDHAEWQNFFVEEARKLKSEIFE